jgi:tRNA threonylcarbamoyl adenosine modification protein TsaD
MFIKIFIYNYFQISHTNYVKKKFFLSAIVRTYLHVERLLVLGIETSCDDTGVAIVSSYGYILAERVVNQHSIHEKWGGVVPKFAKEAHKAAIDGLIEKVILESGVSEAEISAMAVTIGPGLSLCLREGFTKAHNISRYYRLPIIPVHHMEAHAIIGRQEKEVPYPYISLLVSGGHNILILSKGIGDYLVLGSTLDDSIGEAFDKVARLLELKLEPSGGASIERLASNGNPKRYYFPPPLKNCKTADFSFSGMKSTARILVMRNTTLRLNFAETKNWKADIAASFQISALKHLISKIRTGINWGLAESPECRHMIVAGGVAANYKLRQMLSKVTSETGIKMIYPPTTRCSDNGVMVAWAGIERLRHGLACSIQSFDYFETIKPRSRWPLGSIYLCAYRPAKSLKIRNLTEDLTALTKSNLKRTEYLLKL